MVAQAIANVLTPSCLVLIWFGTIIGIIFGSIPGLSATMAVVLFLPLTFSMEVTNGLALLVGLYMGGMDAGGFYGDAYDAGIAAGSCASWAINSGRMAEEAAKEFIGK